MRPRRGRRTGHCIILPVIHLPDPVLKALGYLWLAFIVVVNVVGLVLAGAAFVFVAVLVRRWLAVTEAPPVEAVEKGTDDEAGRRWRLLNSIMVGEDETVVSTTAAEAASRCPTCSTAVDDGEGTVCPRCGTGHHDDCWQHGGGCSVFGCTEATGGDDEGAREPLVRRVRRWYWLVRVKWWISLGFWAALSADMVILPGTAARTAAATFSAVMHLAALAYFVLLVAVWVAQTHLEWTLGRTPAIPPDRERRLVARLQNSRSRPYLFALAEAFPLLYIVAGLLTVGAGTMLTPDYDGGIAFGWFLVGVLPSVGVAYSARKHQLRLEWMRWRLHATVNAGIPIE